MRGHTPARERYRRAPLCRAAPGRLYVLYLPAGGSATLKLDPGRCRARRFSARTGERAGLGSAEGPEWKSPGMPDGEDWAVLVEKQP